MIRATGLDIDIERTTHPLMIQLREAGLVRADPLGLGVEATADFEAIDAGGCAVRGLYCLGPLLRGRLWEITAVPELRDAAAALAQRLLSEAPDAEFRAPQVSSVARSVYERLQPRPARVCGDRARIREPTRTTWQPRARGDRMRRSRLKPLLQVRSGAGYAE